MVKIILTIFLIVSIVSYGEPKEKAPIVIEAKKLIYKKKEHLARYIGDVSVKKDDIRIFASQIDIFLDKTNKIKRIVATGDVRFLKGRDIEGSAKTAILENDKVILKGNAKIRQKSNIIEGDIIVFNIKTGSAEVKGEKVRTIIFPQ